jgi:osmotically-inducible protein OsmY
MADRSTDLEPYLTQHLREALARDPRVGELGVDVHICDGIVVLTGTVTSLTQQEAASVVARELLPQHGVRNEIAVAFLPETPEVEHLP